MYNICIFNISFSYSVLLSCRLSILNFHLKYPFEVHWVWKSGFYKLICVWIHLNSKTTSRIENLDIYGSVAPECIIYSIFTVEIFHFFWDILKNTLRFFGTLYDFISHIMKWVPCSISVLSFINLITLVRIKSNYCFE